jgi:serine/threonine-protein kinase
MERIGEYLVRRLVGEGGMGKVFEAEERLSRRRVALKVLKPELARSEEGRRLFLNEMTILAHLDHPNVVRCLACTEVGDDLVMALELLEGRTLREHLAKQGALSWEEAVDITVQIASALAAAHRQEPPIVHRDLKPENVMVLDDGGVKVMDFGIAKVLAALSENTTHSVGTIQYMSPEQIDARGVDGRSDLYCLGLVLYEMLEGKAPFQSPSPRELLNLQCTAAPPPLSEAVRGALPKGVERLLFELLEKRADDRPGSASDVLHELEPFAPASVGPRQRPRTLGTAAAESGPRRDPPPSAPSAAPEPEKPARAPKKPAPEQERQDTIALVERAAAPREVPARLGVAVVVLSMLIAGLVTYLVRAAPAEPAPGDPPVPTERAAEDPR